MLDTTIRLLGGSHKRDPVGFAGGVNLYAYAGGNPTNFVDPLGTTAIQSQRLFGHLFSANTSYTAPTSESRRNNLSFANNVFTSNNRTFGLDQKFRITASQASRIVSGIPTSEQDAITTPFCCNADDIIGPVKGAKLATTGALAVGAGIKIGTKGAKTSPLPTPTVSNQKLQNIVKDLFKGTTNPKRVGTGTTADAVRNEIRAGQATGGRFHTQKAQQYSNALKTLLRKPGLSEHDRRVAQSLLDDLQNALGGK